MGKTKTQQQFLINLFRRQQLRPTNQRLAILRYLLEKRTHPTAREIYNALTKELPTLSLTTVYNCLEVLTKKGLVQTITLPHRQRRYDSALPPHAHFYCQRCGQLWDIALSSTAQKQISLLKNPVARLNTILLLGVCRRCQAAGKPFWEKRLG